MRCWKLVGPPRGFTLVELIITISIVAILAAIALPNFGTSLRNSRVTTQANELIAAFNLARSEAVTRTRGITVCAADTSAGVPTACGASTDWQKGWVVFMDSTAGAVAPGAIAASDVLRTWVPAPKTTITTDDNFVRFNARGENVSGDKATLTIVPSDACTGDQQRTLEVNAMGRANSARAACP